MRLEEVFVWRRRHRRGRLGVVISLALLAACDPRFTRKGEVVDAAGRPLANARVELVCYGVVQNWTTTGSKGHFRYQRLGAFGKDCAVAVEAIGHEAVSRPVLANCSHPYLRDTCTEVTGHVTLR
jgi:hypothetical protein